MDQAALEKRFHHLTHHARRPNGDLSSYIDSEETVSKLSEERKSAWKKLISSVATVESIENVILKPVSEYFEKNLTLKEYLESHAADEALHADLFTAYVEGTFHYHKRTRSLSDQVIYDRALPFFAQGSKTRPIPFTLAVYFYEKYAAYFYQELKRCALIDGLLGLHRLIESIEKDEIRHMVGIESVFHIIRMNDSIKMSDRFATRALIELLLLDVNQSKWAFYNRKVRKNMEIIGMNPEELVSQGKKSAQNTLLLLENP